MSRLLVSAVGACALVVTTLAFAGTAHAGDPLSDCATAALEAGVPVEAFTSSTDAAFGRRKHSSGKTIAIQGSRGTGLEFNTVSISGIATGFTDGEVVVQVKEPGKSQEWEKVAAVAFDPQGRFAWSMKVMPRVEVMVVRKDATSNLVRLPSA